MKIVVDNACTKTDTSGMEARSMNVHGWLSLVDSKQTHKRCKGEQHREALILDRKYEIKKGLYFYGQCGRCGAVLVSGSISLRKKG